MKLTCLKYIYVRFIYSLPSQVASGRWNESSCYVGYCKREREKQDTKDIETFIFLEYLTDI